MFKSLSLTDMDVVVFKIKFYTELKKTVLFVSCFNITDKLIINQTPHNEAEAFPVLQFERATKPLIRDEKLGKSDTGMYFNRNGPECLVLQNLGKGPSIILSKQQLIINAPVLACYCW